MRRAKPVTALSREAPFESWEQINALASQLDAITGPMVVFGAATGLRPAELVALEQRDVDRTGRVVYVRRQLVRGRVKQTKTRRSIRAVPLQSAALEALDRLPETEGQLLFPAPHGGHIDLHNFRPRHWRPAQTALGIDPIRRPYDLRHTYATFALRAGPGDDRSPRRPPRPATGAITLSGCSTPTRGIPPRGRQVDVAAEPATRTAKRLAQSLTHDVRSGGRFVDAAAPKRLLH